MTMPSSPPEYFELTRDHIERLIAILERRAVKLSLPPVARQRARTLATKLRTALRPKTH